MVKRTEMFFLPFFVFDYIYFDYRRKSYIDIFTKKEE